MCTDEITVFIIDIDFFFSCPDLKFLSQIFPGHAIMDLVEGEGEILCYFNGLSFQVFKAVGRKGQKSLLLFCCKEIVPGIRESFKGFPVFSGHLLHQDAV